MMNHCTALIITKDILTYYLFNKTDYLECMFLGFEDITYESNTSL